MRPLRAAPPRCDLLNFTHGPSGAFMLLRKFRTDQRRQPVVQSNEFKGATLAEAVKKATAAYNKAPVCEVKNQRRCNDLILEISRLQSQIGFLQSEANSLLREANRLENDARAKLITGLLGAVAGTIVALRGVVAVIRMIRAIRAADVTVTQLDRMLGAIGVLGGALLALKAFDDFDKAREFLESAQNFEQDAQRKALLLEDAVGKYHDAGCSALSS